MIKKKFIYQNVFGKSMLMWKYCCRNLFEFYETGFATLAVLRDTNMFRVKLNVLRKINIVWIAFTFVKTIII